MKGIVLDWIWMVVSSESLLVQVISFVRMGSKGGEKDLAYRHLFMTVGIRVAIYSGYVAVAAYNLVNQSFVSPQAAAVLTLIAIVWQVVSLSDVRVGRYIQSGKNGKV